MAVPPNGFVLKGKSWTIHLFSWRENPQFRKPPECFDSCFDVSIRPGHQLYWRKTNVTLTQSTTEAKQRLPSSELCARSGPWTPLQKVNDRSMKEMKLEAILEKMERKLKLNFCFKLNIIEDSQKSSWIPVRTMTSQCEFSQSARPVTPPIVSDHVTTMISACTIAVAIHKNWISSVTLHGD